MQTGNRRDDVLEMLDEMIALAEGCESTDEMPPIEPEEADRIIRRAETRATSHGTHFAAFASSAIRSGR